jgi:hypothetical protein
VPVATVWFGPAFATGGEFIVLIVTVLAALDEYGSLTTSCMVYDPGLSGTKVGFSAVALLSVAVLPVGLETKDHE